MDLNLLHGNFLADYRHKTVSVFLYLMLKRGKHCSRDWLCCLLSCQRCCGAQNHETELGSVVVLTFRQTWRHLGLVWSNNRYSLEFPSLKSQLTHKCTERWQLCRARGNLQGDISFETSVKGFIGVTLPLSPFPSYSCREKPHKPGIISEGSICVSHHPDLLQIMRWWHWSLTFMATRKLDLDFLMI